MLIQDDVLPANDNSGNGEVVIIGWPGAPQGDYAAVSHPAISLCLHTIRDGRIRETHNHVRVTPNRDSSGQGEKRSVTLEPDKIRLVKFAFSGTLTGLACRGS